MTQTDVAVVGAGSWGTTLAKVLGENGRHTLLWTRREELCREINESHQNSVYLAGVTLPTTVEATHDLARICKDCRFILVVVPSHGMREIASELGDHLSGEHVVVHATKGIEQGTFKRMSQVLAALERGSFVPFAALFRPEEGRSGVTVTFVALLELVRESLIEIVQAQPYGPLHVRSAAANRTLHLVGGSEAPDAEPPPEQQPDSDP